MTNKCLETLTGKHNFLKKEYEIVCGRIDFYQSMEQVIEVETLLKCEHCGMTNDLEKPKYAYYYVKIHTGGMHVEEIVWIKKEDITLNNE